MRVNFQYLDEVELFLNIRRFHGPSSKFESFVFAKLPQALKYMNQLESIMKREQCASDWQHHCEYDEPVLKLRLGRMIEEYSDRTSSSSE